MAVYVRNDGNPRIYFALAYHYPNCPDGENWAKKGWWQIPADGTVTVRGGASNGAKYFWYAETDTGLQWAGDLFTWLPTNAFDWCWPTSSTNASLRRMRRLDVPRSSVTKPSCSADQLHEGPASQALVSVELPKCDFPAAPCWTNPVPNSCQQQCAPSARANA